VARPKKRQSFYHGLLIIDKPEGFTSQDVVNVVRKVAKTRRTGHTGTLDPLATGLLILLLGDATKLSEYLITCDKVYTGTMLLGQKSNTYDIQGEIEKVEDAEIPSLEQLQEKAQEWVGEISQVPPPYSAVKIKGKKLYEYARAGEEVVAKPRQVTVSKYNIVKLEDNEAHFEVACTSGTYVRSLVHELGEALGCGALISSLRRTEIEEFKIDEAITLDQIRETEFEAFGDLLVPMMDAITSWPIYHVAKEPLEWLLRGQAIPEKMVQLDVESDAPNTGDLAYLCPLGKDAIAVGEIVAAPPSNPPAALRNFSGRWIQPVKVMLQD